MALGITAALETLVVIHQLKVTLVVTHLTMETFEVQVVAVRQWSVMTLQEQQLVMAEMELLTLILELPHIMLVAVVAAETKTAGRLELVDLVAEEMVLHL